MVKNVVGNYIDSKRPPVKVRHLADLNYEIKGPDVIIYETRPAFDDIDKKVKRNIAKATFIPKDQSWNVFWMRANNKWHPYEHGNSISSISDFIDLLKADKLGYFWG